MFCLNDNLQLGWLCAFRQRNLHSNILNTLTPAVFVSFVAIVGADAIKTRINVLHFRSLWTFFFLFFWARFILRGCNFLYLFLRTLRLFLSCWGRLTFWFDRLWFTSFFSCLFFFIHLLLFLLLLFLEFLPSLFQIILVGISFVVILLPLLERFGNEGFSYSWWESHVISWLHFIEKVRSASEETEHCI